jgi:2-methylcitrate dehydratase PrpD
MSTPDPTGRAPLRELAQQVSELAAQHPPAPVLDAARRTLGNVLATAVGAATESAVDIAVATVTGFAQGQARIPGRAELVDPIDAALVTGLASHLDDYDDTHLATVIHPGGVCLAALLALGDQAAERSSHDVLTAVSWGVEVALRLGLAISPEHYDEGWHITGTCGAAGAAVTAGLLTGLSPAQLHRALVLAVEDGVGHREAFGSMTKSFHVGRTAVLGVRAARDALRSSAEPGESLAGPQGLAARSARGRLELGALLSGTGERWELLANTFKPYPCGIVSHPAIEAAEALAPRVAARGGADAVTDIRLTCHPLVPELTGNPAPIDGLQARFSTVHGIAAGLLVPGAVGPEGYADTLVASPAAARLRSLTVLDPREDMPRDAARLEIRLGSGEELVHTVDHARGSLAQPLTDADLLLKTRGLVDPVLGAGTADVLHEGLHRDGPGYLRALVDVCTATAAVRPPIPTTTAARPVDDGSLEHDIARLLTRTPGDEIEAPPPDEDVRRAVSTAVGASDPTPPTDPRARAEELATVVLREGHAVPVAAAAAAAVVHGDGTRADEVARATDRAVRCTRLVADRTGVQFDHLAALSAAAACCARAPLPRERLVDALGIAATQVTAVRSTMPAPERHVRRAVYAGIEAHALAARGFTGPAHPLSGRRGLAALVGRTPDVSKG